MVTLLLAVVLDPPHPFATTVTVTAPVNVLLHVATPADVIVPAVVGDNDQA